MIRLLAAAAAVLIASGAASAQAAYPELERASRAVAAIWRPIDLASSGAEDLSAACSGWEEEMRALDDALPEQLTPEALAQVRAARALIIVPTAEDPAAAFVFPSPDMAWLASGLGRISVLAEAQGLVGLQDAAGRSFTLQLGRHGAAAVMRVRSPGGDMLSFVGCAPTVTP